MSQDRAGNGSQVQARTALLKLPTVKEQLLFGLGFPNSSQIDGFIKYIKNELLETEKKL